MVVVATAAVPSALMGVLGNKMLHMPCYTGYCGDAP